MGDAGQSLPAVQLSQQQADIDQHHDDLPQRTVNVLVTGFGPFKSFSTNPSFLIASALPQTIDIVTAQFTTAFDSSPSPSLPNKPIRTPHPKPYRISIHVHPDPIIVAYDTVATEVPQLIAAGPPSNREISDDNAFGSSPTQQPHASYDYILHIGMAAGRDNYTLETLAHRDGYIIKDVQHRDGFASGEHQWRRQSLPSIIHVGWHKDEVLRRWEALTNKAEDEFEGAIKSCAMGTTLRATANAQMGELLAARARARGTTGTSTESSDSAYTNTPTGDQNHADTDANANVDTLRRNLAATTLSTSTVPVSGPAPITGSCSGTSGTPTAGTKRAEVKLSKDAGRFLCEYILYTSLAYRFREARDSQSTTISSSAASSPDSRLGKVAFLHVPGGTTPQDTARGARVAVAAIRALVGSWEDGYRNGDVYDEEHVQGGKTKAQLGAI